jgi:hypothetical protein
MVSYKNEYTFPDKTHHTGQVFLIVDIYLLPEYQYSLNSSGSSLGAAVELSLLNNNPRHGTATSFQSCSITGGSVIKSSEK